MAVQQLNNGESYGSIRNKANANFQSLENAIGGTSGLYHITGVIGEDYKLIGTTVADINTKNVNDLYAIYDALVTAYPNYVTRTLLATEESGLPIYAYNFLPTRASGQYYLDGTMRPKIVWSSAVHGHEPAAAYAGALFFKDLCTNWGQSSVLRVLRMNVHFIAIPAVNPYGFNQYTRTNFNGVDLNRNFPDGWVFSNATPENYTGTEPLSEVGSQTINQFMIDNPDIKLWIDGHNFGGSWNYFGGDYTTANTLEYSWMGVENQAISGDIIYKALQNLHHTLVLEYGFPDNKLLAELKWNTIDSSLVNHIHSNNINAALYEVHYQINGSYTDAQKVNTALVGELFKNFVIKYRKK